MTIPVPLGRRIILPKILSSTTCRRSGCPIPRSAVENRPRQWLERRRELLEPRERVDNSAVDDARRLFVRGHVVLGANGGRLKSRELLVSAHRWELRSV